MRTLLAVIGLWTLVGLFVAGCLALVGMFQGYLFRREIADLNRPSPSYPRPTVLVRDEHGIAEAPFRVE